MRRIALAAAFILSALVLAVFASACFDKGGKGETLIRIGFNPSENTDSVTVNGQAFSDYLTAKTGLKTRVYVASGYAAVVEALAHKQIEFSWIPPFSLIQAEKLCKALPLLKIVRKGSDVYYGGIIVRKDSPYQTIEDLKGKDIAWPDVASASGHIFPKAAVMAKDINVETFFNRELFAGGHDKVVLAVLTGQVAAGGTFMNNGEGTDGSWNRFYKDRSGEIRALLVTKPIPNDVFATTEDFAKKNPEIVKKIIDALYEMTKDPQGKEILQKLYGIDGLAEAKQSDFDVVRDAARFTNIWKR